MDKFCNPDLLAASLGRLLGGRAPVILCIGSDRVTGDALGPIVGHLLKDKFNIPAYVYGCLSAPVTALNVTDVNMMILERHKGLKVLAIDSGVGEHEDIGVIRIHRGCIYPGSAGGKDIPGVGDISITATVADKHNTPLSSVRLGAVFKLAESIAETVYCAVAKLNRKLYSNNRLSV